MSNERLRLYVWFGFAFCVVSLIVQGVNYSITHSPFAVLGGVTNIGAAVFAWRVLARTRGE